MNPAEAETQLADAPTGTAVLRPFPAGHALIWGMVALLVSLYTLLFIPYTDVVFRTVYPLNPPRLARWQLASAQWFRALYGWVLVWLLPIAVPLVLGVARRQCRDDWTYSLCLRASTILALLAIVGVLVSAALLFALPFEPM